MQTSLFQLTLFSSIAPLGGFLSIVKPCKAIIGRNVSETKAG